MLKALPGFALGALLLSGCTVFGSQDTDERLEQEISMLMLDQQILETRLSLAEDRIFNLQTSVNDLNKSILVKKAPESPQPAKKNVQSRASKKSVTAPASNAPALYKEALGRFNAYKYKESEAMFRDFIQKYPNHNLAPNAGYWLGESYYGQKLYVDAILAFQSVVREYPRHQKAADSLLKTGYSYRRLDDLPNARFYLEQVLENYPASESAPLARAALARL